MLRLSVYILYLSMLPWVLHARVDPFSARQHKKIKLPMSQKYQYLGFIKGPHIYRGFVRAAGGEVQGLDFGHNSGFGEVILLTQQQICIFKQHQRWCLDKSVQAKLWRLGK
jgi:hypothetical protein